MTAALKNRVRPAVGSLALGSTLVLSGCVTDLTGIGAGSDFACPMADGTLCASMADISQMSRRGALPWEQRRGECFGRLRRFDRLDLRQSTTP